MTGRTICAAVVATAAIALTGLVQGQKQPGDSTAPSTGGSVEDRLQELLDRGAARGDIPSGFLAVIGPDFDWSGAAGERRPGAAATAGDAFFIHSVTKTITAAAVLRAAEDGLLGLDQPVVDLLRGRGLTAGLHVMDGVDRTHQITVRQLLAHRSGLADYFNAGTPGADGLPPFISHMLSRPEHVFDPSELIVWVRTNLSPLAPPGTSYSYSDTGFVLLGLILEQVYRRELREVYRDVIFEPLGMEHTWMAFREADRLPDRVARWLEGSDDITELPAMSADWAGGGLISTAPDLARFILGLHEGGLFNDPASLAAMRDMTPVEPEVLHGLGMFRVEGVLGGVMEGHEGYGGAYMFYLPHRRVAIAGTWNQAYGAPIDVYMGPLLSIIDALPR